MWKLSCLCVFSENAILYAVIYMVHFSDLEEWEFFFFFNSKIVYNISPNGQIETSKKNVVSRPPINYVYVRVGPIRMT